MKRLGRYMLVAMAVMALPAPAMAGWSAMVPNQAVSVAKSNLKVTPSLNWNKSSRKPSPKGEMWTLDGPSLNELIFFAGIANGETIVKDRNKKDRPLPRFRPDMLLPDVVQLVEATMRISLDTSVFEVEKITPAKFAGQDGVHFTYHYVTQSDEVRRRGEARAAIINGKLYLITFAAPALHYFDADVGEVRTIMDRASF